MIYLDHAAGTPLLGNLQKKVGALAKEPYNPSALYAPAKQARQIIEASRQLAAKSLAVLPRQIIFTAGATEANQLVRRGLAQSGRQACLNIDHPSLRALADVCLPVNQTTGLLELSAWQKIPDDVACLSLAGVNSEVGVKQSGVVVRRLLNKVAQDRQKRGLARPLWLHLDASQMPLTGSVTPQSYGADLLTLGGGKIGGLVGSGLLYVSKNVDFKPDQVTGGQERGWRPGTESLPAIYSLAQALAQAQADWHQLTTKFLDLQTWFEAQLQSLGAIVVTPKNRSPHISSLIFPNQDNERLVFSLSQKKIYVGVGSACHSQANPADSILVTALGYSLAQAQASLRFSYGRQTTKKQLTTVVKVLKGLL